MICLVVELQLQPRSRAGFIGSHKVRKRSLHTKFSVDHSLLIAKGQVGMQKPQFMKMGVLTMLIALHTTEESE